MSLVAQTQLTRNAPVILDATCSPMKRWPRFATLRMDIKREAKPDIVADAKNMPFRKAVFDEIYCDPPHNIRHTDKGYSGTWKMARKRFAQYGFWRRRADWLRFINETDREFARCLKGEGKLHFKIAYNPDSNEMVHRNEMEGYKSFKIKSEVVKPPVISWSTANVSYILMEPCLRPPEPEMTWQTRRVSRSGGPVLDA